MSKWSETWQESQVFLFPLWLLQSLFKNCLLREWNLQAPWELFDVTNDDFCLETMRKSQEIHYYIIFLNSKYILHIVKIIITIHVIFKHGAFGNKK